MIGNHPITAVTIRNFLVFGHRCRLVVRVSGYRSRGPGFSSRRYQIFCVVGLERRPLSVVSKIEELLGRNSSGFGLESREYGRGDSSRLPRDILYPQKLVLTSLISCCLSVSIVCSRTEATEFVFCSILKVNKT
jgi:hypothetical protein